MIEGKARKMRERKKERSPREEAALLAPQGELGSEENLAALLHTPLFRLPGTAILISPTLRSRGYHGCL